LQVYNVTFVTARRTSVTVTLSQNAIQVAFADVQIRRSENQ